MKEQKYLIAIALAEQNEQRIMPIGGKTISEDVLKKTFPKKEAQKIVLDLLLRLFKRTSQGKLKIADKDTGIFIAEIRTDDMQNKIPILKANWINNGNTNELIVKLTSVCNQLWSINYEKYEGMVFNSLDKD